MVDDKPDDGAIGRASGRAKEDATQPAKKTSTARTPWMLAGSGLLWLLIAVYALSLRNILSVTALPLGAMAALFFRAAWQTRHLRNN